MLAFALLAAGANAAVRYDMTKAELLQELGKPTSVMKSPSGREVLIFPKGVRIELENGKVVSVKGLDLAAAEQAEANAATEKATAAENAKRKAEEEKAAAAQAAAEAKAEKEWADQNAKARADMEKSVEAMEKEHDASREQRRRGPPPFEPVAFLIGMFVKWVLVVAALRLAAKYWNADIDWSGVMIAAGVETGVRAVLSLVAQLAFHVPSLFYLDDALALVALILVLRKVSTNQSMNQAVTIAFTVKTFSIVVGSVVTVALMGLLH